jgi:hypothetical protein
LIVYLSLRFDDVQASASRAIFRRDFDALQTSLAPI